MRTLTLAQLKELKEELAKFYILLKKYIEYITKDNMFPQYKVLCNLVQNLQFDGSDCSGYNHEEAVKKVYQLEKLIQSFNDYYKDHVAVRWICDEVSLSIQYVEMKYLN